MFNKSCLKKGRVGGRSGFWAMKRSPELWSNDSQLWFPSMQRGLTRIIIKCSVNSENKSTFNYTLVLKHTQMCHTVPSGERSVMKSNNYRGNNTSLQNILWVIDNASTGAIRREADRHQRRQREWNMDAEHKHLLSVYSTLGTSTDRVNRSVREVSSPPGWPDFQAMPFLQPSLPILLMKRGIAIGDVVWQSEHALWASFLEIICFAACRQVMNYYYYFFGSWRASRGQGKEGVEGVCERDESQAWADRM